MHTGFFLLVSSGDKSTIDNVHQIKEKRVLHIFFKDKKKNINREIKEKWFVKLTIRCEQWVNKSLEGTLIQDVGKNNHEHILK